MWLLKRAASSSGAGCWRNTILCAPPNGSLYRLRRDSMIKGCVSREQLFGRLVMVGTYLSGWCNKHLHMYGDICHVIIHSFTHELDPEFSFTHSPRHTRARSWHSRSISAIAFKRPAHILGFSFQNHQVLPSHHRNRGNLRRANQATAVLVGPTQLLSVLWGQISR